MNRKTQIQLEAIDRTIEQLTVLRNEFAENPDMDVNLSVIANLYSLEENGEPSEIRGGFNMGMGHTSMRAFTIANYLDETMSMEDLAKVVAVLDMENPGLLFNATAVKSTIME